MDTVAGQIYEKEKNNRLMVSILSHIVEFRSGESGSHVVHINLITEMLRFVDLSTLDKRMQNGRIMATPYKDRLSALCGVALYQCSFSVLYRWRAIRNT